MKEKKSSGNIVLIIAIAIIVVLLIVIWNMQAGTESTEEDDVTYIDLDELVSEEDSGMDEIGEEAEEPMEEVMEEKEAEPITISEREESEEIEEQEEQELEEPQDVEAPAEFSDVTTITVTEGDLVSFPNLKVDDPDGDPVTFTFTKPLDRKGEWQTKLGDAGTYEIRITASDGEERITETVMIVVEALNVAPRLGVEDTLRVDEGEVLRIDSKITDPDGDTFSVEYSGWMTSNTKAIGYDDSGTHDVTITATDSNGNTAAKEVTIIVRNVNRPPKFERIV